MAFSGVALTLMLSAFDISTAGLFVSGLKVWQLVLTIIEIVCSIGSIIMVLIATVWFLILLHGRTVKVFKSEDIIDKWYTDENIDRMLMERHLNKKARRGSSKNHIKGPKKRTNEDDERFAQSFEKLVLMAQAREGEQDGTV